MRPTPDALCLEPAQGHLQGRAESWEKKGSGEIRKAVPTLLPLSPAQSPESGAHQCQRGATWQSPAPVEGAWSLRPGGRHLLPHLPMDSSPQLL